MGFLVLSMRYFVILAKVHRSQYIHTMSQCKQKVMFRNCQPLQKQAQKLAILAGLLQQMTKGYTPSARVEKIAWRCDFFQRADVAPFFRCKRKNVSLELFKESIKCLKLEIWGILCKVVKTYFTFSLKSPRRPPCKAPRMGFCRDNYFRYFIIIFIFGLSYSFCIKLDPDRFKSQYYKDGRFRNIDAALDKEMFEENTLSTNPREKFFKYKEILKGKLGIGEGKAGLIERKEGEDRLPKVREVKTEDLLAKPGQMRIVWLGHATNWIAIHYRGQRIHIITDPLFGDVYWLHRRITKFPIAPEHLPPIDAVLVSHAHADHLDIKSLKKIQELNPKVRIFLPDGNRLFAKDEGLQQTEILEWWQKRKVKEAQISFTPSHHWTRMALNDKYQTHWGSYVIKAGRRQIFFSGDTGYSKHFKQIAKRYPGGFDAALTEIRFQAYWSTRRSHLSPKEAIQANKDLGSRMLLPIHWGTFPSNHSTLMGSILRLKEVLAKDKNKIRALIWHPGHLGLTLNL